MHNQGKLKKKYSFQNKQKALKYLLNGVIGGKII
jgi:hypothetical protein